MAFQAASAVQTGIRWDDDIYTSHADFNEAKSVFRGLLDKFREAIDDDAEIILCYSCPTRRYFRHELLPTYKANRSGQPPLVLKDLKAWSSETWPTKTKPGLEADDVLGILATHPKLVPGEKVIVSADKDLRQIPGRHLDARRPFDGEFAVTQPFAERLLWLQVLAGDTVDNYTGIPGIGPAKADKILQQVHAPVYPYESVVREAYERAGLATADMAVQVNVARILTSTTYNFKTKEPILWHPSTIPSTNAAPATAPSKATPKSRKASKA